jgi:hypothetical protein
MPDSINYFDLAVCIAVPATFAVWFTMNTYKRLTTNHFFNRSLRALRTFLYSRAIYVFLLGMMTLAFLYGIIRFGKGGEETRHLIATAASRFQNTPTLILSGWSHVVLPFVFLTIFLAIGSLGYMGRLVLRDVPAGERPGGEYGGFRFTFFMLALSLMLPPLIFGSLLML